MQGLRAELQHPSSTLDVSQSVAAGCFNSSSEGSGTLMLLPLLRLLTKSTRLTMTRNAVWALSNLCRGKNPPPAFEKVTFVEVANLDLPLMLHVLSGVALPAGAVQAFIQQRPRPAGGRLLGLVVPLRRPQ